jgi:hypothetical protein
MIKQARPIDKHSLGVARQVPQRHPQFCVFADDRAGFGGEKPRAAACGPAVLAGAAAST